MNNKKIYKCFMEFEIKFWGYISELDSKLIAQLQTLKINAFQQYQFSWFNNFIPIEKKGMHEK